MSEDKIITLKTDNKINNKTNNKTNNINKKQEEKTNNKINDINKKQEKKTDNNKIKENNYKNEDKNEDKNKKKVHIIEGEKIDIEKEKELLKEYKDIDESDEKQQYLMYRKRIFFNFMYYMYDYTNRKKDRVPLNQVLKDFKFYYFNIVKINQDDDKYDYDYISNYTIKDLKNDLKHFININSRNYNNLPIDKQNSIKCYYDLDTIINNQRGALCKVSHKHNIILIDDNIIDSSLSNSSNPKSNP